MSSVHKADQKEAETQFLMTARKLEMYTIERCTHQIPKRYTFYIGTHLADSAHAIYANMKKGNSIYPKNRHEVQMRRDYFLQAYAEAHNLVSQVEVAYEVIRFDTHYLNDWSALITDEISLIKGLLTSDGMRYKNIE